MAPLPQLLEQVAGLGTLVVGGALAALSAAAWRRERDRRMLLVGVAYLLFAVHGLVVFGEYLLLEWHVLQFSTVELLEHGSAYLILVGLLVFFVAIFRE
ncbi:MAG: hypothetical protein ABEJ23_04970 [Haloarculaceae archaeon]